MNAILNTINSPRSRRLLLATIFAASLGACASVSPTYHHVVMRGQVLSTDENSQGASPQAQICIGTKDGAAVGQTFDVIRHVKTASGPKGPKPGFRREQVGQVRIVEIYGDHYANVEPVSGGLPKVGDMVELRGRQP
jgi:hypothetical protein